MKDTDSLDGETSQGTAPSTSKRALLKSAWVAPLVIAVTLPRSGLRCKHQRQRWSI